MRSFSDLFWSISASFSRSFSGIYFCIDFWGRFWNKIGSEMGPKTDHFFIKLGSISATALETRPGSVFGRFLVDFGPILEPFWGVFCLRFGASACLFDLSDLCGSLLACFPSFCLRFPPFNRISFFLSSFFFQEPRRTANRCTSEARKRAKRAQRAKRWQETTRSNGRRHGYYLSVRSSRSNARLNPFVSDSLSLFAG